MNTIQYSPIQDYPIDSVSTDIRQYIKAYKSAINYIFKWRINNVLTYGTSSYKLVMSLSANMNDEDRNIIMNTMFYVSDVGLYEDQYHPDSIVLEMIKNHPNAAITDLDKALIGCIYTYYSSAGHEEDYLIDFNYKELLFSFVFFLHNVQRYELMTHKTIDFSKEIDEAFVFEMFLNPMFVDINSQMVELSDFEIQKLEETISYRNNVIDTVTEARINEKKYALNEQNQYYWEQFISLINYRLSEELRVVELINSDVDIKTRYSEFEQYIKGLFDNESQVPGTVVKISDLLDKYNERYRYAFNYLWVKTDSGKRVLIDTNIRAIVDLPFTFNCVLIAYHLFLIRPTENNLWYLAVSLCFFIIKNLSQYDNAYEGVKEIDSSEKYLAYTIDMIFGYYEEHRGIIDSLEYNKILNDENLSGFNFDYDIYRKMSESINSMKAENVATIRSYDLDKIQGFVTDLFELSNVNDPDALRSEFNNIVAFLPNKAIDPYLMKEQEVGKRLIHSINAIYILVNALGRAFEAGLIKSNWINELKDKRNELNRLERNLVRNTYRAPDYHCFDSIDMDKYRLDNGIDATLIEKLRERALFELAEMAICDIDADINKPDYNDASTIKQRLREELKYCTDDELKRFVENMVDQVSQKLGDSLIANNIETADFGDKKTFVLDYIGPSSSVLPEVAINALATAELLFDKYATQEYANAGYDYSCISSLYYQAFESIYNGLLWSKYASMLNSLKDNGDWFTYLYKTNNLSSGLIGYLPSEKPNYFLNKEKKRIIDKLTMGNFNYLLYNVTSCSSTKLPQFRAFIDKLFGYDNNSATDTDYQIYQSNLDELYKQIELAIPKRNAASHGVSAISLAECKADKKIVLSDLESIRNNTFGLVILFVSLFKTIN